MNIDYSIIGKRIKDARNEKKLTQETLAEYLDVSIVYISRIERGSAKINLETLVKISNFLDVSPSYILTGAVYSTEDYMRNEILQMLKGCSPEKIKLIANVIKPIVEYK
ncbi:MAG: helix-turn-helix domain-containing protein [Clostridia bacterium]|nr:helix-turn-helix domain-containing protein [Clostridia bacterium]